VDIRTLARPVLERIFEQTGETVHFARLERTDVQFIDAIESRRAVRVDLGALRQSGTDSKTPSSGIVPQDHHQRRVA